MENKGKIRFFTALFAGVLCMAVFPLQALAGSGEETPSPNEISSEPATDQEPDA